MRHHVLQRLQAARSLWYREAYSVLSIRSDLYGWALDQEATALQGIARRLGLKAELDLGLSPRAPQCCHYTSQFVLDQPDRFRTRHRVSLDYFHGRPQLAPQFAATFAGLTRHHEALARLRVAHTGIERMVLESGIDPNKVHRIPIGLHLGLFPAQTPAGRANARRHLGLPASAVVVGSFQKDGEGWEDGNAPKAIKGPDVLLRALDILKSTVPELWVLLTGPARGFVRRGLEEAGIPYRHVFVDNYAGLSECYRALDAYVIPSRDEGGPKAVLEAMASGVPLVTTRVGQAVDLVRHGANGWMVDSEDAEGLAHFVAGSLSGPAATAQVCASARKTAEGNSYEAQLPLWASFFRGYVEER